MTKDELDKCIQVALSALADAMAKNVNPHAYDISVIDCVWTALDGNTPHNFDSEDAEGDKNWALFLTAFREHAQTLEDD